LGPYGETLVVDWGLAKEVRSAKCEVSGEDPASRTAGETGTAPPPSLHGSNGTSHSASSCAGPDEPTRMGEALGTPAFMSPEQAAGRIDQLGPASDVYSLGATLYYILTGKPPVEDSTVARMLERVKQGDFPRPGQHN